MQRVTIVDIETASQPPDVLAKLKPEFVANKTLKDPLKIAADLAAKEAAWIADAALDATTAQVLVVGILEGDTPAYLEGSEKAILERFWPYLDEQLGAGNIVTGFCIFHFDLPFLYRRALCLGVPVKLNHFRNNNRYWRDGLVDIAEQWQLGNRDQRISLDMLARVLGVGAKNGDGKDFAALYATDRVKALQYLENDLRLSKAVYERMNP